MGRRGSEQEEQKEWSKQAHHDSFLRLTNAACLRQRKKRRDDADHVNL
jgi:hypothetical protein